MNFLDCNCQNQRDRIIDSRMTFVRIRDRDVPTIRRRRVCEGCGARGTTFELLSRDVSSDEIKPGRPHPIFGRDVASMTTMELLAELQQREFAHDDVGRPERRSA